VLKEGSHYSGPFGQSFGTLVWPILKAWVERVNEVRVAMTVTMTKRIDMVQTTQNTRGTATAKETRISWQAYATRICFCCC